MLVRTRRILAILFVILLVVSLSFYIILVFGETAFADGFEDQTFNKWDGNGATSWLIGTYGSGSGGSADPYSGDYDAYTCENQIGNLVSDDINLLGVSEVGLSFWFQTDDVEPSDIYLYLYDGSVYNLIGTIDTGVDDTWLYYFMDITNTYWVSNFRIQFVSSVGKSENVWIDDVLVNKTVSGNTPPTNDLCDADPNFDVDIYGWVKQTVTDIDGVADLKTVDIQVTTIDSKVFVLRWTQSTNVFSEESDTNGICTLDISGSQRVNIDSDTDRIEYKFQISVAAQTGYCSVQSTVVDDADAQDQDNYPNEFTINFYSSITVTDSTHAWTGLSPGDSQILVGDDGDIDFTITSNADFDIQAKSDGNLISGSNTIAIANVKIHASDLGGAISLTTSYADVPGLTAQTRGEGLTKSLKLWLTVPLPQEDGAYSYTLYVQVIQA